tara:strand:- start:1215 stop:1952 length:738 start_codon:yes stop_codon:yes gene_type:complete
MDIELCSFSSFEVPLIDPSIRIELCSNYSDGGLSPSPSVFIHFKKQIKNPIFVMIRPRGGDFYYSEPEFQWIKGEVNWFKAHGASGFVLGLLCKDGSVDLKRTKILVDIAHPLPVTFHRAFDMSFDVFQALEDVILSGCKRILTSGSSKNVVEGFKTLIQLKNRAQGRIEIMPGGGVDIDNVYPLIQAGFKSIHLSSKKIVLSPMQHRANLSMTSVSSLSSFDYVVTDLKKLNNFISYVRRYSNP